MRVKLAVRQQKLIWTHTTAGIWLSVGVPRRSLFLYENKNGLSPPKKSCNFVQSVYKVSYQKDMPPAWTEESSRNFNIVTLFGLLNLKSKLPLKDRPMAKVFHKTREKRDPVLWTDGPYRVRRSGLFFKYFFRSGGSNDSIPKKQ